MKKSLWALLLLLLLVGEPQVDAGDNLRTSELNLSGHWDVIEEVDSSNCGEGTYTKEFNVEIDHKYDVLTVNTPDAALNGFINNGVATWSGRYSESGGTIRVYSEVVFSDDGSSFEGNETWNWENGSELCVGTGRLSGFRSHISSDENDEGLKNTNNPFESRGCFINELLADVSLKTHRQ